VGSPSAEDHLVGGFVEESELQGVRDLVEGRLVSQQQRVSVDFVGELAQAERAGAGAPVGDVEVDVVLAVVRDDAGLVHKCHPRSPTVSRDDYSGYNEAPCLSFRKNSLTSPRV